MQFTVSCFSSYFNIINISCTMYVTVFNTTTTTTTTTTTAAAAAANYVQ
jgi:hypothetical protein